MTDNDGFDPEWLKELNLDDPVKRAQFIGQLQLMTVAWKFLETAVRDGDLRATWGLVHEPLREQLGQQWVIDNGRDIQTFGFDEAEVVAGLAANPPSHPL